ncbi:hypothetical protein [Actinoplanes solisilvae]|uniref:hypothetical protein n=1 Tax=Actinoplanes solisilvae TaxID=2486853 RepID=UPI000FD97969|nr:hypothetical protein [Actinoplanes solisilvae]
MLIRETKAVLASMLDDAGAGSSAVAPTDGLASGHLWSFGKALDKFFGEAVALPGWAWALSGSQASQDVAIVLDQI